MDVDVEMITFVVYKVGGRCVVLLFVTLVFVLQIYFLNIS